MLTKVNLKDHFVNAVYVNNERTLIEVFYTSPDFKETHNAIIEHDTEHPDFQHLMKFVSVDDLHENTYNQKKLERKEFEEEAIKIAKKSGLVFDYNRIDTKFFPALVKALFVDEENDDHLFALKLALFEVEKIRDTKNEDLKVELRKSKTKLEALDKAINILRSN
tara:strand:+ start:16537 stop:17031 length:495 start_codon:yes stop_codon:yes gene_type:complete